MFAYCGNNPVNKIDALGCWGERISEIFRNGWKKIKAWFKDTFGAGFSTTSTLYEDEVWIIPDPSPITIKQGTTSTQELWSYGDSTKPISVYAEWDTTDPLTSSAMGLNLNLGNYQINANLALDDFGITGSYIDGNSTDSFSVIIDFTQVKAGLEIANSYSAGGITVTNYSNISASGIPIITIAQIVVCFLNGYPTQTLVLSPA